MRHRACQYRLVLAAVNIGAVALGVATGGLVASIIGLLAGSILSLSGLESGPDLGLIIGIVLGLGAGGWIAGLRSRHSERFHGAITGLIIAFLVMTIARLGGSPATIGTILWLALISVGISGFAGWAAGRRHRRTP